MSGDAAVRGLSGELNNVTDSVVAQAVGRLKNAAVCDLMLGCGTDLRISYVLPELSVVRQVGWCCCIVCCIVRWMLVVMWVVWCT